MARGKRSVRVQATRAFKQSGGAATPAPQLPSGYENIAVYCQIGDGDVYQKPIQGGSTTFVDVQGEQIACSWFVVARQPAPAPQEPAGPSGSITVREFLCEGDSGSIQDWERECVPGTTGTAYTLAASDAPLRVHAERLSGDERNVLYTFRVEGARGTVADGRAAVVLDAGEALP